jgi:tetratricopeptide (TPR) repeat protein
MEAVDRTRVTTGDVETVVDKAMVAGEAGLAWLWVGLPTAERFVLSAVAHAAQEGRAATQDEISHILKEYYVWLLGLEVIQAPDRLTRWEFLRRTVDGYEFIVELLRRWILREHPLEQARRELELASPRAASLYELASKAHQANELVRAIRFYRDALAANPNHLQAQLGLARALFEQGKVEEAIIEYEEMYRLNEVMARDGLIAARQKRAEALEKASQVDEADQEYETILRIAPHDRRVVEWVANRWITRGGKHLGEGHYEEAVAEFEKAAELNVPGVQEGLIATRRAWAEALKREGKEDEADRQYETILRIVSEVPAYRNPFIFSDPVATERFIGRKREVRTIFDRLANPTPGSTAVSGETRIGKTSLLHYISSPKIAKKWGLSPEKCTFIFMDGQTIAPFSPLEFWHYVLKSLAARKAHEAGYIEGLLKRDDVRGFELGELVDRIARDAKLVVLLLDEFEYVVKHLSPDDPELLYLLRALINRPMRGLALVLASGEPLHALLRDFRFSGSPFPTSFTLLSLGPFSPEETNKLIDVYTRDTGVTFSETDKDFAYEISKGHPYWLQKVCFKLFQRYMEKITQRRSENEWRAEIAEEISEEMEYTVVVTKEPGPISEKRVKKPVVLHLSDLQFGPHHAFEDNQRALDKLKEDIDRYEQEGIPRPNIVVVSGDLADTGGDKGDEYGAVTRFLEDLCRHLGIDNRHVVLVPGNHDVNWYEAECIEAELKLEFLRSRRSGPLDPHSDVRYLQRFGKYAEFYNRFYSKDDGATYYACDLSSEEGWNTVYNFHSEWGIAFLALSSCEKEDHHPENHYGHISPSVLVSALKKIEEMTTTTCVKVAVFHHNALAGAGEDRLRNFRSEILPPLSQAGFSLVLHGHTHKPDVDDLGPELTEGARVRVVGAGSVSVARAQRPGRDSEGQVPNQYWVLAFELGDERKQFTAYARQYDPNLAGKHTQGKWIP